MGIARNGWNTASRKDTMSGFPVTTEGGKYPMSKA